MKKVASSAIRSLALVKSVSLIFLYSVGLPSLSHAIGTLSDATEATVLAIPPMDLTIPFKKPNLIRVDSVILFSALILIGLIVTDLPPTVSVVGRSSNIAVKKLTILIPLLAASAKSLAPIS